MIDFTGVSAISIPEGSVAKIANSAGEILWEKVTADYRELYQRVEYVHTAGSSGGWFLTDFIANNTSGLEFSFSVSSSADIATMGSRTSASDTRCYVFYPRTTTVGYIGWKTAQSWSVSTVLKTMYTTRLNWLNSRKAVILNADGTTKATKSISGTLPQQVSPIGIGRYNNATNSPTSARPITIYGARMTQDSEIVREYIPCYRKSDGEIGLYETFTGQFVTNAGTGTLTKGEDVEW